MGRNQRHREFRTLLCTSNVFSALDSDGFAELSSWVRPSGALLAIDRNNDGVINDAGELFGNGFVLTQGSFPLRQGTDGFRDLDQYDLNYNIAKVKDIAA